MHHHLKYITRAIFGLAVLLITVLGSGVAQAGNPIHTNCSGTHCAIDAIWLIFRNSDVNNPVTQDAVTTMNMDTSLVQADIANQLNHKTSFVAGDTLTVPINASGELISTGAQFYDSPPVYFDAGGVFRAIMQNVASCQSVAGTLGSSLNNFSGNFNNCINSAPDNSPLIGTWSDSWTTSAGPKLTCSTGADGATATCTSLNSIQPGTYTITLTRTVKDLKWSAKDLWLNKTGIPTMNLHPFYSIYGYTSLFAGWDTLHDAPMKSSATVTFVEKKPATVDLTVGASPAGPFTNGPITISKNAQAYLHWTSQNATSCSMTGALTATGLPATGLNYPTGNLSNTSNVFKITCTGPGGVSSPDSVTVLTVNAPTPTPSPSASPSASPTPTATPVSGNNPPVSVASISAANGAFGSSITVEQSTPVSIKLSANGSSDPDGWTTPGTGVSQGGKCEWNSDLNQGAPTFESTVVDPSSPAACQISLGTLVFNDVPGTYTYNLLRITDAAGAQSNNGAVSVTVVAKGSPTPTASPTATASPSATPTFDPGSGFQETR